MADDAGESSRQRVYSACQACRLKKIKCDGDVPCLQCRRSNLNCQAGGQRKKRAVGLKDVYIRELERRVAELERHLAASGKADGSEPVASPHGSNEADTADSDYSGVESAMNELKLSSGKLYRHEDTSAYKYFGSSSAMTLIDESDDANRPDSAMENFMVGEDDEIPRNFVIYHAQLPSPAVISIFVDTYFDTVHTVFPMIDELAFRAKLDDYRKNSLPLSVMPVPFLSCYLMVLAWGEYYSGSDVGGTDNAQLVPGWRYFLSAYSGIEEGLRRSNLEFMQTTILSVLYLHTVAKSSVAYLLTGILIRLMQAAGMHRASDKSTSEGILRTNLINVIYIMEKNFSLTLGRPSGIQDFDCDFLSPHLEGTPAEGKGTVFPANAQLARLVGRTQAKLYSPEAARRPLNAIEQDVVALETELLQWRKTHLPQFPKDDGTELPSPSQAGNAMRIRYNNGVYTYINYLNLLGTVKRARLIYHIDKAVPGEPNETIGAARAVARVFVNAEDLVLDPASWLLLYHVFTAAVVLYQSICATSAAYPTLTPSQSATQNSDIIYLRTIESVLRDRCRSFFGASRHLSGVITDWISRIPDSSSSSTEPQQNRQSSRSPHSLPTPERDAGGYTPPYHQPHLPQAPTSSIPAIQHPPPTSYSDPYPQQGSSQWPPTWSTTPAFFSPASPNAYGFDATGSSDTPVDFSGASLYFPPDGGGSAVGDGSSGNNANGQFAVRDLLLPDWLTGRGHGGGHGGIGGSGGGG